MHLEVDIGNQSLLVREDDRVVKRYAVSTARNGAGELLQSEQTPRGWHVVRARIGADQPVNTVFRGRRPTGEIYSAALRSAQPERDWILTRILWLSGLEVGKNRLGAVDTMRRFIYIHGCPDEDEMGVPGSHGCIKMRNQDVIELFNRIPAGTRVFIHE
jgi:L,D-transpeptidase YbiS